MHGRTHARTHTHSDTHTHKHTHTHTHTHRENFTFFVSEEPRMVRSSSLEDSQMNARFNLLPAK